VITISNLTWTVRSIFLTVGLVGPQSCVTINRAAAWGASEGNTKVLEQMDNGTSFGEY
jgi:hypothetical protein